MPIDPAWVPEGFGERCDRRGQALATVWLRAPEVGLDLRELAVTGPPLRSSFVLTWAHGGRLRRTRLTERDQSAAHAAGRLLGVADDPDTVWADAGSAPPGRTPSTDERTWEALLLRHLAGRGVDFVGVPLRRAGLSRLHSVPVLVVHVAELATGRETRSLVPVPPVELDGAPEEADHAAVRTVFELLMELDDGVIAQHDHGAL